MNRGKTGRLRIRIMYPSEATSSTINTLFSVLSSTKRKALSSRQNVNCSRHDIAEKLLNWR